MSYALPKTTLFDDFHLESEEPVYKVSGGCQSQNKEETVSLGVFEQVKWERDVAIEQLEELGYSLGEKIRTDEDAISRQAVLDKAVYTETEEGWSGRTVDVKVIEALPPVKPKVDVDALINKIETELSWSMYDDWGNTTGLHDGLVGIIREWAGRSGEE